MLTEFDQTVLEELQSFYAHSTRPPLHGHWTELGTNELGGSRVNDMDRVVM